MESDHEGSLGSDAMEEELDEDLYGESPEKAVKAEANVKQEPANGTKMEEDEDEDDDDEDSDLDIILESTDPAPKQPETNRLGQPTLKNEAPSIQRTASSQPPPKSTPQSATTTATQSTTQSSLHLPTDLTLKDGRSYPAYATSKIEVNGDALYNGKPISDLDIDVDIAEHMKPWRVPGADPADWFNYGFDEFTWTQYQMKRKQMTGTLGEMPTMDSFFQQMMGGGGMPGMPGMPGMDGQNGNGGQGGNAMQGQQQGNGTPGPMGMGGMPDEAAMMSMMQQAMGMQGGGMPGMPGMGNQGGGGGPPSGPGGWHQQGGGGGHQGGRRGGRGGRQW